MEQSKVTRAGYVSVAATREIVTCPSSRGWRKASSAVRLNSGNSSRKSTPWCASDTSPGRGLLPPPASLEVVTVWCPERPPRDERPVALPTRAVDLGHFDALLHGERRQYSRHPACQHCLPRARRPTHPQVVRPRRSHLQSPLCVALPGNVRKVLTSL